MGYPDRVATRGAQRLLPSLFLLCAPAPLFAAADLAISKSSVGGVKPGADLVYTIVVTNLGPDTVTDAIVADATPPGLTFVSNTGDCATAFPCALSAMAQGQIRTIVAKFNVPAGYWGRSGRELGDRQLRLHHRPCPR